MSTYQKLVILIRNIGSVNKPYIIINCACSADGKLATIERKQTRISSPEDIKRVQMLRNSVDAILVGIGTIKADDPHLTVKRGYLGKKRRVQDPIRIVVDSKGRIPNRARVLDGKARTIIAVATKPKKKIRNVEVLVCGRKGKVDLRKLMNELTKRGIRKLLVEGGGDVIWSILSAGLADELRIFVGNVVFGGKDSPTVADGEGARSAKEAIKLRLKRVKRMDGGTLLEYLVLK
jgi:2,5-diamino-6-(ribosylamino)-4(3H)-pyrimidinone 5'-phosphate reductase